MALHLIRKTGRAAEGGEEMLRDEAGRLLISQILTEDILCARQLWMRPRALPSEDGGPRALLCPLQLCPLQRLRGQEAHGQLTLHRVGLLVPGAELSPRVDFGLSFLYRLWFPSAVLAPVSEVGTLKVYVPLHLGFLPGHLEFIPGTCSR